jgi:hypothetical protein
VQAPGAEITELKVKLDRTPRGDYRCRVATPDGSGTGVFVVPDEDLSLEPVNAWIEGRQEIKRSSSRGPRDRAVEIGRLLFRGLFAGSLHALYERTARSSRGLRIRLQTDDLAAFTLPWELLYDDVVRQDFVALGTESAVLRTLYPKQTGNQLTPAPAPLRVLVVTADDTALMRVDEDVRLLRELTDTRAHVQVEAFEHATATSLRGPASRSATAGPPGRCWPSSTTPPGRRTTTGWSPPSSSRPASPPGPTCDWCT